MPTASPKAWTRLLPVLLWAAAVGPLEAADGADSPAAINRYATALAGRHPCTAGVGATGHNGTCEVTRGGRASDGIWTYRLTLHSGLPGGLSATLTPHMAGASVQAERTCGGKTSRYPGDVRRKGKALWQGTLTVVDGAAGGGSGCEAVVLTLGQASRP